MKHALALLRTAPHRALKAFECWRTKRPLRCGWVTASTLRPNSVPECLGCLGETLDMRISQRALWMNRHEPSMWHEMYRRQRRYDIVVFSKAMHEACRREAERIRGYGGRIVFDANVNYYEAWGDYDIPGTRPTKQQQHDAIAMTELADFVVADSTYILARVKTYTSRAAWIPDSVDMELYGGYPRPSHSGPLRLVWSGVSKKAAHLLMLRDVFSTLSGLELIVVSDSPPAVLAELSKLLPCKFVGWSERRYARVLRKCDVVISPKYLLNGYEMGHTEYKISLGMAAGLPAVASPQPSYVEAIGHRGGGIVAQTTTEWIDALTRLAKEPGLRQHLGNLARETVADRYSIPVISARYRDVLKAL